MEFKDLSTLNAVLNGISAVLLIWGYLLIRRKKVDAHRRVMTGAFSVSVLFLISYLIYHSQAGATRFQGTGGVRTLYFAVLISHTVLAAFAAPMAIITFWRGLRRRFAKHRSLARWTFPAWTYVSVTGVVVYWMLYHL